MTSDLILGIKDLLDCALNNLWKISFYLVQIIPSELMALTRLTAYSGIHLPINSRLEHNKIAAP